MEIKTALGLLSVGLALVSYVPYLRDILARTTKPHAYSWLTWTLLALIQFSLQIQNQGGPGSWLMGVTALLCFMIFLLALKYGEKSIKTIDKLCLLTACLSLLIWQVSDLLLLSVMLIIIADAVGGFFPTFRKSFNKPQEETASIYFIYLISLTVSIFALTELTWVNALYPATLVLLNGSLALFLLWRRYVLRPIKSKRRTSSQTIVRAVR